jgi:hypothetical protein
MVVERQEAINSDHPAVQEFWDAYDYLNGDDETPRLNHARKGDQEIAVSLPHFYEVALERRQQVAPVILSIWEKHGSRRPLPAQLEGSPRCEPGRPAPGVDGSREVEVADCC